MLRRRAIHPTLTGFKDTATDRGQTSRVRLSQSRIRLGSGSGGGTRTHNLRISSPCRVVPARPNTHLDLRCRSTDRLPAPPPASTILPRILPRGASEAPSSQPPTMPRGNGRWRRRLLAPLGERRAVRSSPAGRGGVARGLLRSLDHACMNAPARSTSGSQRSSYSGSGTRSTVRWWALELNRDLFRVKVASDRLIRSVRV